MEEKTEQETLKELEEELKSFWDTLNSNQDYINAKQRYTEVNKEKQEVYSKIHKIENKVNSVFLEDENSYPSYSKSSQYSYNKVQTNIKKDILNLIEQENGGLSKFNGGDIEEFTNLLIKKALKDFEGYETLRMNYRLLDSEWDILFKTIREFERGEYFIKNKILEIKSKQKEEQERKEKPEKFKRELKREQDKKKLLSGVDKIYNSLKEKKQ